jgi:nucleoid DNA-binding protein
MIPKKANELYKSVAEDLNIEESLVEDLVDFMYKNLRKNLSNLTHPRINLDGLGQFVVKTKAVNKSIERITTNLLNHDTYTFSAYFNKKTLESKLASLIKLEAEITQQKLKKDQFKKKKDETKS